MIQELLNLSYVRVTTDLRVDLYDWIAQGLCPSELKAFQSAPYNTLTTAELLRVSGIGFGAYDLSQSLLFK
jgi:hypothetical protein